MSSSSSSMSTACLQSVIEEAAPGENNASIFFVLVGIFVMLYAIAKACEDYLVPALLVLCKRWKLSDSLAGSSIMAAGCNLPELMVAFIGLFIIKSAIGVGTIVGSVVFNQMIITAGACMCSTKPLRVEWKAFTRDCLFYLLSLLLFIWAVKPDFQTSLRATFSNAEWTTCLIVNWPGSLTLLCGQVLYVLVAANFDFIVGKLEYGYSSMRSRDGVTHLPTNNYKATTDATLGYEGASGCNSARSSSASGDTTTTAAAASAGVRGGGGGGELELISTPTKHPLLGGSMSSPASPEVFLAHGGNNNNNDINSSSSSSGGSLMLCLDSPVAATTLELPPSPPSVESHTRGLLSSNNNNNNSSISSSSSSNGNNSISSIELVKRNLNLVDDATDEGHAADEEHGSIVTAVSSRSLALEEEVEQEACDGTESPSKPQQKSNNENIDKLFHFIEKAAEIVCLPVTFVFHYTIPGMKINMESGEELDHVANKWYPLTIFMAASWVILYAYVLCLCFSVVGHFFGISSAVIGLTLSAAGTSFPNFWSSIVAAKIGRGDMAISNALGSCTFCFFFCLGLPWLLYNIVEGEYNTMLDGGIVLLTIMLCIINVAYYVLIALHSFEIPKWMGVLFCCVYAIVITAICIYFP